MNEIERKIKFIEQMTVEERTDTDHHFLVRHKYNNSMRDYLLSMGAFKDIKIDDDLFKEEE